MIDLVSRKGSPDIMHLKKITLYPLNKIRLGFYSSLMAALQSKSLQLLLSKQMTKVNHL